MDNKNLKNLEVWMLTGSQHLYGAETLKTVAEHAQKMAEGLNQSPLLSVSVQYKPIVTTPEEIYSIMLEVNAAKNCIGVITWMHTFSPAKMWISGLKILQKPLLHLHTQFNRDIPWEDIDMDFMNLNQSAHGDREFGFIMTRMNLSRKVLTGHWNSKELIQKIDSWMRPAAAWHDWQGAKLVRFGDNMRYVAVTEGDKVEAEQQFGYSVNYHGVGDLYDVIQESSNGEIDQLVQQYESLYQWNPSLKKGKPAHESLRQAAKIEIGLEKFLTRGDYKGFTNTFEDLHGLKQLPGIAVQRLMEKGYGFGAEGDWKTAALVRAMKTMAKGLAGGNSFMEDYTYHFEPKNQMVLGAHMLEICPSIADSQPYCDIHPLSIGGKEDPVRLIFQAAAGKALNASMIDLGNRFRMLVNRVEAVKPEKKLPKLPVARALWKPMPSLEIACTAWILAGGAHHTCYSQNLSTEHLENFAEIAGIEFVLIDQNTELRQFKNELRWNEVYYRGQSRK